MAPIVQVKSLAKNYYSNRLLRRTPFAALRDVSFEVEEGEILGIVGESGSGKTTLARSMLFLEPPSRGEVWFQGACLNRLIGWELRRIRTRMQIIFQDPNSALNPRLTIGRSMEEGLSNFGVSRKERHRRILELLDQVGIPNTSLKRYPHEFSGGQKQRIVVARALSLRPRFLVLDEPVSNLDVSIQAGIINLLLDLKKEYHLTYVFISHDLNLIGYLCDRVGVLHQGRLVEIGQTEDLFRNPADPYTAELLQNLEWPDPAGDVEKEGV
jgi:peptide/nickel transport system ATP-binding protein